MIKKNKWKLIISSIIILLPILIGLTLWNQLPDSLTTHWGMDSQANGWSSKPLAVLLPPIIILALHWICVLITAADPRNQNQNAKAFGMVLWIIPFVSLYSSGMIYAAALGMELSSLKLMPAVLGLMFVLIGNYLPKYKRNSTIGIKVSWALNSDENWNATHRFGGKVWMSGGIIMMICAFFPGAAPIYGLIVVIITLAVIPAVYSYLYYKKQLKEGLPAKAVNPVSKWTLLGLVIFLSFLFIMASTGDIQVNFRDNHLYIEADRWDGLTVEYDAIDRVEYRNEMVSGSRTNGFGGFRVLMGTFENEEFGSFTRYTYVGCDCCIVITAQDRTLILSGRDEETTREIYEDLLSRTG